MQPFSCIILAGGLSSRMGCDKALLPVRQHRILLTHMVQLAQSAGAAEVLVSRSPALQPEALGHISFVADEYVQQGPLAGLHACLPACKYERILVLPVDMPALTEDMLKTILNSTTSACFQGYELPLVITTNTTKLEALHGFITQQLENPNARRSIREMLNYLQVNELPVMNEERMLNTNSANQWQQFLALLENN